MSVRMESVEPPVWESVSDTKVQTTCPTTSKGRQAKA